MLGINTARSFVFKGGRVSKAQLARVARELCPLNGDITKIVVTHHPYMGLEPLARCGVDILMAGHLHDAHVVERAPGMLALMVQAGTATSSRTREEPNSFNLLRVSRGRVEVEQHVLNGARLRARQRRGVRARRGRVDSLWACLRPQPHSLSPRALAIAGWTAFALAGILFLVIGWSVTARSPVVEWDARPGATGCMRTHAPGW